MVPGFDCQCSAFEPTSVDKIYGLRSFLLLGTRPPVIGKRTILHGPSQDLVSGSQTRQFWGTLNFQLVAKKEEIPTSSQVRPW